MGTLTDHLDRFVRWFFNSSPTASMIEPHQAADRQDEHVRRLRQGAFGGALIAALVLLAVFYSVVAGAVEHAASRRNEAIAGQANNPVALHTQRSRPVVLARAGG